LGAAEHAPTPRLAFTNPQGTVGAGLPVLSTLKHLVETGDRVLKIEGIFSGTLSYIFNTFGDGRCAAAWGRSGGARGACNDARSQPPAAPASPVQAAHSPLPPLTPSSNTHPPPPTPQRIL
jgi:hypothetical protein